MNKYKITNITDLDNQTRTDGRYPNRIGSIIEVVNLGSDTLRVGDCLVMEYIKDNKNKEREGVLRTSTIQAFGNTDGYKQVKVYTLNSIYYLDKVE